MILSYLSKKSSNYTRVQLFFSNSAVCMMRAMFFCATKYCHLTSVPKDGLQIAAVAL